MRISTNMMFQTGSQRISTLQSELLRTQEMISANTRILTPSDDPTGAARVLEVTQSQSLNTQYSENRGYAISSLNLEDSILESVTNLIQDVQTQIVEAGDGSYDADERGYIADDLRGRLEELVGLANTKDNNGNYLFSGYMTGTQPFSQVSSGVLYNGDQGTRSMQVATTRQMSITDTGDATFMRIPSNVYYESGAAISNTSDATVSAITITDSTQITNHDYNITYDYTTNQFTIEDLTTGSTSTANYTGDPQTLSFDGMQITIEGTVSDGDMFMVRETFSDEDQAVLVQSSNGLFETNVGGNNLGSATISPYFVSDTASLTGDEYEIVFDETLSEFQVTNVTTGLAVTGSPFAYTGDASQTLSFDGLKVTISAADTMVDGDKFTITQSTTDDGTFVTNATASNTGTGSVSPMTITDASQATGHEYLVTYDNSVPEYVVQDLALGTSTSIAYTGDPQTLAFDGIEITISGAVSDGDSFEINETPITKDAYFVTGVSVGNTGEGSISPLTVADASLVTGHEYQIAYDDAGAQYVVTDLALGTSTNIAYTGDPQTLAFDGLEVTISGAADDGDSFTVRQALEPGESPAIVEEGSESVFDMLNDLIDLLDSSSTTTDAGQQELTNGLALSMANFNNALDHILTVRASVGSRLQELDSLDSAGENRDLQYAETLSNLQDLDYAKAISDLAIQTTILEAAQQSYVQLMNMSLFQYI